MILAEKMQSLPCPLNTDELLAKGDALANTLREIENEEDAQVAEKAAMKERLAALLTTQGELRQQIQERREFREVPVDILVHDVDKGIVREVRRDTGEIVRERFIEDSERQQWLRGLDGPR